MQTQDSYEFFVENIWILLINFKQLQKQFFCSLLSSLLKCTHCLRIVKVPKKIGAPNGRILLYTLIHSINSTLHKKKKN
jgi:hypothetical protein